MNEEVLKQKIAGEVLGKVRSKAVRMRSRTHFLALSALSIALSIVILILSAFICSFIFFSLHESGEQFLLGFGLRGVATFLALFPWLLLVLDIVLILALEWLLKEFRFGYRLSLVALFSGVFGLSLLVAAALYLSPLHVFLLNKADEGRLPLLGGMYEDVHDSHHEQGIFRGTIVALEGTTMTVAHDDHDRDSDDGLRTVTLSEPLAEELHVGEHVFIFGTSTGARVTPYGIRPFDPDR